MTHFLEGSIQSHVHRRRTAAVLLVACLAVLAGLLSAGRADAGVLASSAAACDTPAAERPFVRWGDSLQYVLAPDGDFDHDAAGWQRAGAEVVADNEPWNVHGSGRTAALHLPAGASATSPAACVGVLDPTVRLFARNGDASGSLQVEVLFEDPSGASRSLTIGTLLGGDWAPTRPMPIVANLLSLLTGSKTPVAFRFTARGGDWTIDDLYIDPWGKG